MMYIIHGPRVYGTEESQCCYVTITKTTFSCWGFRYRPAVFCLQPCSCCVLGSQVRESLKHEHPLLGSTFPKLCQENRQESFPDLPALISLWSGELGHFKWYVSIKLVTIGRVFLSLGPPRVWECCGFYLLATVTCFHKLIQNIPMSCLCFHSHFGLDVRPKDSGLCTEHTPGWAPGSALSVNYGYIPFTLLGPVCKTTQAHIHFSLISHLLILTGQSKFTWSSWKMEKIYFSHHMTKKYKYIDILL